MPVFDSGALLLEEPIPPHLTRYAVFDSRRSRWVTTPHRLRDWLSPFAKAALFEPKESEAKPLLRLPPLRRYQEDAFRSWRDAEGWGGIELPTGAGKTRVALEALCRCRGRSLILVPTRVLLRQWANTLSKAGFPSVGVWGDGQRMDGHVVVGTYASAAHNMMQEGDRFALLVVDEAHHLASPKVGMLARLCTAPLRMALSATFPVDQESLSAIEDVCGPVVRSLKPCDLPEGVLAPFDRHLHRVPLSPQECHELALLRGAMKPLLGLASTMASSTGGFAQALRVAARKIEGGRLVLAQYQHFLAHVQESERLVELVRNVVAKESAMSTLIFCATTDLTLKIATRLGLPAIVAGIGSKERTFWLERLANGDIRGVVTCRALNEGYDLPSVERALLVGGSRSETEYLQRLGRVLRAKGGARVQVHEILLDEALFLSEERKRSRLLGTHFQRCDA